MELDDFKHIVNQNISKEPVTEQVSFKKVKGWKSLHPAEKIKNKVFYENLLALVLIISLLFLLIFLDNSNINILSWIFIVIAFVALVYGFSVYNKLRQLINFDGKTKDFLVKFNTAINGYIKILSTSILAIGPALFYVSFTLGFSLGSKKNLDEVINVFIDKPKYILIASAIVIPSVLGTYYLVKYIYKKLYGSHINQINELIKELE